MNPGAGVSCARAYSIRHALADDAETIHALMVDAFGYRYLPYTIFQSPQSVAYLRTLIVQSTNSLSQCVFLACLPKQAVGYYHAVQRDNEFFLNYVAAAAAAQGKGVGSALLRHYENTGQGRGCQRLALDVFESNAVAREWYIRHGYRIESATFSIRVLMDSVADTGTAQLTFDSDAWTAACQEEKAQGFSKLTCRCGAGEVVVGFIAEHACKLLSYKGITFEESVRAIARRFHAIRDELIVHSLPSVPAGWHANSIEKILRFSKRIEQGGRKVGLFGE